MECPQCSLNIDNSLEKCDCGYVFAINEIQSIIQNDNNHNISAQRYIVNVIVRLLFFFGILPILLLFKVDISKINKLFLLPYGMILFLIFGVIGSLLDIILPKNSIIGAKIAIWAFNFSTLTWFEGMEFNVSVNAGFRGKGVSIKEERE